MEREGYQGVAERVGLIVGGLDYERHDVERAAERILSTLKDLGHQVAWFDLVAGFEHRIRDYAPHVCFIVDPYYTVVTLDGASAVMDARVTLEQLQIPYTGSGPEAAAISRNKELSKVYIRAAGVATPSHEIVPPIVDEAWSRNQAGRFGFPVIIKPLLEGASVGLHLCADRIEVERAIEAERSRYWPLMLEEYIAGVDVTVGVVGREERCRALLPHELELLKGVVYDSVAKQQPELVRRHVPARLSDERLIVLQSAALRIHRTVGCRGLSRIDFRVTRDEIVCLEINGSPLGNWSAFVHPEHAGSRAKKLGAAPIASYNELVIELILDAIPPH